MSDLPSTLFVGRGHTGVCWYRCALPAMALGLEWVGVAGAPPKLAFRTGAATRHWEYEHLFEYEVVVLQQPHGKAWEQAIRKLQAQGTHVLFEIDDHVQSVRKMTEHVMRRHYGKGVVLEYERAMALADGIVCSTPFLADRYREFNDRVHLCRNGIDLRRYDLEPAERPGLTIGWAGASGHARGVREWLPAIASVMRQRPDVRFMSIGVDFVGELAGEFGPERVARLPFLALETYPAAMTMFDVAVAPAGANNFFRAKSDLRWLEASALGIPLVADPNVYPEIEHGVTGFHAVGVEEVATSLLALVDDHALRERVGAAANAHVREHRSIQAMSGQWAQMLREAAGTSTAAAA